MNAVQKGFQRNRLINLGLTAGLAFYIGLIVIQAKFPIFDYDFIGFWSVGRIASTEGYSKIYDLSLLIEYQNSLGQTEVAPMAFPAIFILPFQVIALLPLQKAAWVWRTISLLLLVSYCAFFSKNITNAPLERSGFFVVMLALPVYINFAWAQVDAIPLIAIGEFIRLSLNKRPFLSGIALGLLLIKPQLAVLLILMLLVQWNWKTLTGFITSAIVVVVSSNLLTGLNGSLQLLSLWVKFSAGIASNAPEYMANWRMLGIHLKQLLDPAISWIIVGLGMAATVFLTASTWRKKTQEQSPLFFLYMIFCTLSATLLTSWHSHVHHMVILIPPLLAVIAFERNSEMLITYWVFSGILLYLFVLLLGFASNHLSLPDGFGSILLGIWGFASSLIFFKWTLRNINILAHTQPQ